MAVEIQRVPWRPGDTVQMGHGGGWHQAAKASNGQFWRYSSTTGLWAPHTLVAGDIPTHDHGSGHSGLTDDDHSQYALLAGRSGGQILRGGTATGDTLRFLANTANGSDGEVQVYSEALGATGAQLALWHNSGTPAANDVAAVMTTYANDANATKTAITAWNSIVKVVTAAAMSSVQAFRTLAAGVTKDIYMDPTVPAVYPNDNDFWALGGTSNRWTKVWAKDIDYSGTLTGTLPAVSREIPYHVTGNRVDGGGVYLPNEAATNYLIVWIYVPTTWDGSTNITLTTVWFATASGLVDLETEIVYHTEVDEASQTVVQAMTNTNLTWTTGVRTKILTTTLSSLAAGRHYRVRFQRNTGDANAGDVYLFGARAVTAVR